MARTTKTKQVKEYLMQGNVLTDTIAYELFHLNRLSAVIFNLRQRGMNIETKMLVGTDCNGNRCDYGQYRYIEEE